MNEDNPRSPEHSPEFESATAFEVSQVSDLIRDKARLGNYVDGAGIGLRATFTVPDGKAVTTQYHTTVGDSGEPSASSYGLIVKEAVAGDGAPVMKITMLDVVPLTHDSGDWYYEEMFVPLDERGEPVLDDDTVAMLEASPGSRLVARRLPQAYASGVDDFERQSNSGFLSKSDCAANKQLLESITPGMLAQEP